MGNYVVAAPRDRNKVRAVMRAVVPLRLLRGSFCTVANDAAVLDAGVWGKLPEEILLWEVLRYVPAAKLFQWQLVSRKWRRELTSPLFRNGVLTESWAVQQQQLQEEECVVACVCGRSSSHVRVVNVDVKSMVPSWFWDSADDWPYACFIVVAAAHGLMCISNTNKSRYRYCVLPAHAHVRCVAVSLVSMGQEWTWACGVWRLVRKGMKWENVARLEVAELERLTGVNVSHLSHGIGVDLLDSYGVREFVCFHVMAHVSGSAGSSVRREWLPAFNLDTAKWELLLTTITIP